MHRHSRRRAVGRVEQDWRADRDRDHRRARRRHRADQRTFEASDQSYLIQDENGQPLTYFALRSRFGKARELAGVSFQFRDLRAKAATDTGDLAHSQKLLAHKNREMTEHYVRTRIGERVRPLR